MNIDMYTTVSDDAKYLRDVKLLRKWEVNLTELDNYEDDNTIKFTLKFDVEMSATAKNKEGIEKRKKKASFKLCLDPSLWFDVYLQTLPDFAEAVNIARQYVTTTRLNISPEEEAPFIIDYNETEKDKAFIICPYDFTCSNGRIVKDHPKIYCDAKNCEHYNNETLVQQETFWKELLKCHAYVHLYFNSNTWVQVKKNIWKAVILLKLDARDYPGPNYLLQDCVGKKVAISRTPTYAEGNF
ncbi:3639_t:CDS:2 [Funneliformis geosporum]|nr:3639_t:CDS:2 [Funneliformis geosporum]